MLAHRGIFTTNRFRANKSVTGNPFIVTSLKCLTSESDVEDTGYSQIIAAFDDLQSKEINPLYKTQYRLQKEWLQNKDENIAEAQFIMALIPGSPAFPLPDGSLALWLPITVMHPSSRGSVHITSSDSMTPPEIDLCALNDVDLKVYKRVAKFCDRLLNTEPLAAVLIQNPPRTDAEWEQFIRQQVTVTFHPVGTAPMASKELGGVVDSNLVVYGTKNLPVVDASIFPLQIGTMPQATVYAIAEKAADIIKEALSNSNDEEIF